MVSGALTTKLLLPIANASNKLGQYLKHNKDKHKTNVIPSKRILPCVFFHPSI